MNSRIGPYALTLRELSGGLGDPGVRDTMGRLIDKGLGTDLVIECTGPRVRGRP